MDQGRNATGVGTGTADVGINTRVGTGIAEVGTETRVAESDSQLNQSWNRNRNYCFSSLMIRVW